MNRRVPFDVWYLIFEVLTHRDPNNICKWMRVNKTFNRVLTSWQQNTVNKLQERLANMKRLLADAIDKQQKTVSFDGKTNHYVKNIPQAEFRDVVVLMLKIHFVRIAIGAHGDFLLCCVGWFTIASTVYSKT